MRASAINGARVSSPGLDRPPPDRRGHAVHPAGEPVELFAPRGSVPRSAPACAQCPPVFGRSNSDLADGQSGSWLTSYTATGGLTPCALQGTGFQSPRVRLDGNRRVTGRRPELIESRRSYRAMA